MGRESIIPDPILEENRDQYLEELSKISEAEKWVEKHSVQNNANQDETRIIQKENSKNDNFWSKIFTSFVIGFSIPFLTWISLFSSLGEPCVVFSCSGKLWVFWDYLFANLFIGFVILIAAVIDAIFNRRIFPMIFFFGFLSGSFFGIPAGEVFITSTS